MAYDYEEVRKLQAELEEYASYEGTELGEACSSIADIVRNLDYISEEFAEALIKEMKAQLNTFREDYTWTEEKEVSTRTIKGLDYKY